MSMFQQSQEPTMATHPQTLCGALTAVLLLATTACGDDIAGGSGEPDTDSGFSSNSNPTGDPSGNPTGDPTSDSDADTDGNPPGTDDGEPAGPSDDTELCDAGDEAFVKRLIPLAYGRKPESIREVRLLVSIIEQLEMQKEDGRRAVTLGLLRGDAYLDRYKDYLYEELHVNVDAGRRNETCYDLIGDEANGPELAAFIRDNDVEEQYDGDLYWMPDVTFSALRLDDMSPLLRAETFARMSAPFIAGNVNDPELEVMRVGHFGSLFETTMMGRTTDCLECHTAEDAVTDSSVPAFDRHHPVAGNLELGAYGPGAKDASLESSYAVFRFDGFYSGQAEVLTGGPPAGTVTPFGIGFSCGAMDLTPDASLTGWEGFLFAEYGQNATIVDLDAEMKNGFDILRNGDGLVVEDDDSVAPAQAGAYLMSMHMANRMWTHAMGFPLQVANGFPRNPQQRDILQTLTDSFVANGFSLRNLIADAATHPYFNQSPPDTCEASSAYHLGPVFEPFSREAGDPSMRGNGVGDTVHRFGARVLLESIAHAMWWNKPDVFGPAGTQVPGAAGATGCGANTGRACDDAPLDFSVLRDTGAFLSDEDTGFTATDLVVMLRLENNFGQGVDPGMSGDCTGPLGAPCAGDDWITQLIDIALSAPGADMWDVAAAVKDRMITDPAIHNEAEVAALETLMGVSLSDTVSDVGAGAAEQAARRLAGMLTNTPQFLLAGVPGRDVEEDGPALVVPGTSTEDICEALAPLILNNAADGVDHGFNCTESGITLLD